MNFVPKSLFGKKSNSPISLLGAILFSLLWVAVLYWVAPNLFDAIGQVFGQGLVQQTKETLMRLFITSATTALAAYWFFIGIYWIYSDFIRTR